MKISRETIDILTNFASINASIYIRAGSTIKTKAPLENVGAVATVTEVFPTDFAIYALSDLLSLLKLFDEPDVEFGPNSLTLRSESGAIVYHYLDPALIDEAKMKIPQYNTVFEFDMTDADIKMIHKTASILDANTLSVIGDGSSVQLIVSNDGHDVTNSYKKPIGESTEVFSYHISLDTFKLISDCYSVKLAQSGKAKFVHFVSTSRELDYVLSVSSKSTLG